MSLEDEIRNNLQRIEEEKRAKQIEETRKWNESYKRAKKNASEEVSVLRKISNEYVVPYLEQVNKAMANGRGEIINPHATYNERGKYFQVERCVRLRWNWYEGKYDRPRGNVIDFGIDSAKRQIWWSGTGGNVSHEQDQYNIDLDDPEYDIKMRKLLVEITSDRINYAYHVPFDEHDSPSQ